MIKVSSLELVALHQANREVMDMARRLLDQKEMDIPHLRAVVKANEELDAPFPNLAGDSSSNMEL